MTIWELIALAKSGSRGASSVFHFKGSVLNESSLPDSGEEGDVYLVDSADSYFAWDGEGWTDIGQLLTADEAQEIIADVSNEVSDLKSALEPVANATYDFVTNFTFNAIQTGVIKCGIAPREGGTYLFTNSSNDAINIVGIKNNENTILYNSLQSGKSVELTINDSYDSLAIYARAGTFGKLILHGKVFYEIDEAIKNSMLDIFVDIVPEWTSGYYINYSDGTVNTSERAKYTGFIDCNLINRFALNTSISPSGCAVAFYDEDKAYMKSVSIAGIDSAQKIMMAIPNGVRYMICSEYNYNAVNLSIKTKAEDMPNRLHNLRVMFFGDSITAIPERYRNNLLFNSGMEQIYSFAVSGATLTNNSSTVMDGNPTTSSNNTVPNQVQQMLNGSYDAPDIVVISASTNDGDSNFSYDETQFAYADVDDCSLTNATGAIRWMYEKIMSVYPDAQVFYATPIQSASPSRTFTLLKNKRDVIVESCERMSVNIIDAFYKSGVYAAFEVNNGNGKYLADGLHPNSAGAKVIADCYQNCIANIVRNFD